MVYEAGKMLREPWAGRIIVSVEESELFLTEEDMYRTSEEIEVGTELVLQETAVRFADILREIAEECE